MLVIIAGGVIWQIFIFKRLRDEKSSKFQRKIYWLPAHLAKWVVVGAFSYAFFSSFLNYELSEDEKVFLWGFSFTVLGICLLFSIKTAVSAIVLSVAVAWFTYELMVLGIFDPMGMFNFAAELLVSWAPNYVQAIYTFLFAGSTLTSAVSGSFGSG